MSDQKTVQEIVRLEGVGLHSGEPVQMAICPAPANAGITFVRTDLPGRPEVSAHFGNVVSTQLATTLGHGAARVSTVEHVLAALYGLGIDNALIEVNGPEVPILDGSAISFCEGILSKGTVEQSAPKKFISLKRKVKIHLGEKYAIAEPAKRFEIRSSVFWEHPAIGEQNFTFGGSPADFSSIADARTFGFLKDVEVLKEMGLARGGSLDNAIVLDEDCVLNPGGLRHSDEIVRHKVLDTLGDLKLTGYEVIGRFTLNRSGHEMHHKLIEAIFEDPANYEIHEPAIVEETALGYAAV